MKKVGRIALASCVAALASVAAVVGYASWSYEPGQLSAWVQSQAAKGGVPHSAPVEAAPELPPQAPPAARPAPPAVVVTLPAAKAPKAWLQGTAPEPASLGHGSLARQLQRELKRVGCYAGEIDGLWSPASRSAMKAFTDRVNAALPSDQPDAILLSLVQGHGGIACGATCPSGQGLAADGRCVPSAILARPHKPAQERTATAAPHKPSQPATNAAVMRAPVLSATEAGSAPGAAGGEIKPAAASVPPGEPAPAQTPAAEATAAAQAPKRTAARRPVAKNMVTEIFRQLERLSN
jgi:hypothetical protein